MLKAGALNYTIFVSIVTAILCSLMIVMAYMNRSFFIQTDIYDKAKDNALSGIAIGMGLEQTEDYEEWLEMYGDGADSVLVKKRKWGLYEVIHSSAQINRVNHSKTSIIGYKSTESRTTALWLSDRNRPLQLSGSALLKGDCVLPKKRVDRAYIEGSNYNRKELVFGKTSDSKSQLPIIENKPEEYWLRYFDKNVGPQDSLVDLSKAPQRLQHSFSKKTVIYYSVERVNINSYNLSGNMMLISSENITVSSSARLEQVILVAPTITIQKGFKGSLHAIASDTLIIEGGQFSYPSSCLMIAKSKDIPYLKVSKGTDFRGCLASFEQRKTRRNNNVAVEIEEGAEINGAVYCQGNFELMGKVNGNVFTNNFLLTTPSGIYENHLLNGQIDRSKLDENFATFPLEGFANKSEPIVWLN